VTPPLPSDPSDQEFFQLLETARRGDRDALGRLIDKYRTYLLKIAFEEGDSDLQAKAGDSDIVQNTCLHAVRLFQEFRGDSAREMRAWLRQILLHQLNDHQDQFRAGKRDVAAEVPLQTLDTQDSRNDMLRDDAASPSERVVLREEHDWLESALRELAEIDRKIIEMRQKDGRPFGEIARAVGMTEDAVQKRWVRAIQSLQEKVSRLYGQSSA
jgi:RNA polymerase sigma-70 factor (ECF subfamily)